MDITTLAVAIAYANKVGENVKDKEDTANKISAITAENKSSSTLFPTVGATTQFIENNYYTQAEINSMIGDIGTRLDQVRGVSNE